MPLLSWNLIGIDWGQKDAVPECSSKDSKVVIHKTLRMSTYSIKNYDLNFDEL